MQTTKLSEHFKWLARMGYAARGIVYLVVGSLALMTALGKGGETTDSKGALLTILHQPFGETMLAILVIGLLGYSIWRTVQAVKDPDEHGTSAKGIAVRAGLLISAFTHILLAYWAVKILFGESQSSSQQGSSFLTTDLGQIALCAAGIGVIGAGFAHIYKGWTSRFERYMNISADTNRWARPTCRFGLLARGIVWCIVGWFLINTGLNGGSNGEIKGMAEALESLRGNAYGPWLLGVVAAGLFAFGVYSLLESVYRRIDTSAAGLS